ncbi:MULTISPECIES: hypothetical protein [unclassified Burkholderia]|uniref:hypothetical protein n=1 Tax=unclassified Burkholderia TaxID=2613784 RepID=UPI001FC7F300|nr:MULTISPECIES: hypothetical protein [unclassified Burkholderia]
MGSSGFAHRVAGALMTRTLASHISARQFRILLNGMNFEKIPLNGMNEKIVRDSFRWVKAIEP